MKTAMTLFAAMVLASVRADSDTVALYSFCDGAASGSAVGTVTNSVDANNYAATVTQSGTNPSVVFDADVPGRYLYESCHLSATLLADGMQSINLGDGQASESSGTISFPGVAEALTQNNHEDGLTIEYFFRLSPANNVPNYAATFEFNGGYTFEGMTYPLLVYLPCANGKTIRYGLNTYDSSTAKAGFSGKIDLGPGLSPKLTYPLNDDNWHHFAIVEKYVNSTHQILFYVDRVLVKTHALPATVTCSTASSTASCKLARGNVAGKFAGIRFTSRSLAPDEFLMASKHAPGALGSDVLAFYPFDDRPDGTTALGCTILNMAQPMVAPCTVTTNSAASVAEFSSEGPGKYVFVGERYGATPCYTNPCSIFLSSSQTGDSGTLSFYRLATEISKCHESGHTVEWFFKLTDDLIPSASSSYYCQPGYIYGENDKANNLCLPFGMSASYSEGRQFRFSLDYYSNGRCLTKDLDYQPTDGLWHHVAIVKREDALELYVDYILQGSVALDGTREVTGDRDLALVRAVLHGKFSCVKVTKRSLAADEFLRVSNLETYWPRTFTHLTLDGTNGEAVSGSIANDVVSFAATNATVYAAQDCTGNFSVYGRATDNPCYTSAHKYRESMVVGEGASRANTGSVYIEATGLGETGFRPAPNLRMTVSARHVLPRDFTMEGFYCFDKTSWAESAGTYAQSRPRLNLMSRKLSSNYSWKLALVDAIDRTDHRLHLYAITEAGQTREAITGAAPFKDKTWHHIAVTYNSAAKRLIVYCDHKPVLTNNLDVALSTPSSGYLAIGDGTSVNDNNFHGNVDEVRYSNACLEPEEFLRQERVVKGTALFYR